MPTNPLPPDRASSAAEESHDLQVRERYQALSDAADALKKTDPDDTEAMAAAIAVVRELVLESDRPDLKEDN